MPVEEDLHGLAERPGWTVDGDPPIARFQLAEDGWSATVRRVAGTHAPGHSRYDRWHVAVLDPTGVCRYSKPTGYLSEAWRVAEGWVRAKNVA